MLRVFLTIVVLLPLSIQAEEHQALGDVRASADAAVSEGTASYLDTIARLKLEGALDAVDRQMVGAAVSIKEVAEAINEPARFPATGEVSKP